MPCWIRPYAPGPRPRGGWERLGQLQRSLYLINLDFLLAEGHSVKAAPDDQGTLVALRRSEDQRSRELRYVLREGVLLRELGAPPDSQV